MRKFFAILLSVMMVMTFIPATAWAESEFTFTIGEGGILAWDGADMNGRIDLYIDDIFISEIDPSTDNLNINTIIDNQIENNIIEKKYQYQITLKAYDKDSNLVGQQTKDYKKAIANDGYPICYTYSVPLTDAVYDYLNEVYIEKYPELGLRFKYGTDLEKVEMQTLADQITEGITDKTEQAKAIIRWVRASIEYEYYPESPFPYDTIRTHKGNCTNYALLISQLMRLKGIPAVLVDGWRADMEAFSISDLRKTLKEGHAWVYAYLNGQWIMYDPLFSKDVGFTDRSWISRWYYPNTIEGVVMTFKDMNYSYANRGTGAIYYKGNFQYNDDGVVEGNHYFRNATLGNFSFALNGITQAFTIRIQNKDGTHDGYTYLDDPDNERKNAMYSGQLYTDGWLKYGLLKYVYENGVAAVYCTRELNGEKVYCDPNAMKIIPEDGYWMEGNYLTVQTGFSGYLLEPVVYYDPEEEYIAYSPYENYDESEFTVSTDGRIEAKKAGRYDVVFRVRSKDTGSEMTYLNYTINVSDSRPEPDYSSGTIDMGTDCTAELSAESYEYTGKPVMPEVTVYERVYFLNGSGYPVLTEGEDYEIDAEGDDLTSVGMHTIKIKGKGMYSGQIIRRFEIYCDHEYEDIVTKTATFTKDGTIEERCSRCGELGDSSTIPHIEKAVLTTKTYTYDGKAKKPKAKVTDCDGQTVASSNYSLTYDSNCKSVGTHSVVIKMNGEKYSGTKTLKYKINPKGTTLKSLTAVSKGFTAKWIKQAKETTGYQIQLATNSGFTSNKKTVTISKNSTVSKKITGLKAKKKYYVRIRTYKTVDGTKYYSKWSAKMSVTTKA